MSTRPDLAGVVAAHRSVFQCDGDYGEMQWVECSCGDEYWVDTKAGYVEHEAHLAAALNAAIDAWLADEGTRERMWEAVAAVRDASPRTTDDADSWDVLDAALAALTNPTTTEPEEGKR